MKFLTILSFLVVFFGEAKVKVATQGVEDRISGTGGSLAAEGEFPYVASIQNSGRHICGGFIYNSKWIVTAASCVSGLSPSTVTVVVGGTAFTVPTPQQQTIPVFSFTLFDGYNSVSKMNDIALVSLARPAVLGSSVQYVQVGEVDGTTTAAVTMGWGATSVGGLETTRLRKTSLDLSPSDCLGYGSDQYDANYMVCAGSVSSSPCQYDEGSPLVQNGVAIGIMSKNKGCAPPYAPTIFTRLSVYYNWLSGIAGAQPDTGTTTVSLPTTQSGSTTTTDPQTPTESQTSTPIPTEPSTYTEITSTTESVIPTAPCFGCEPEPSSTTEPPTTTEPEIPTAPCFGCEPEPTTTTEPEIPTAPCFGCEPEPPTTTEPAIPTAPCFGCEPEPTIPAIPTAPCLGCV